MKADSQKKLLRWAAKESVYVVFVNFGRAPAFVAKKNQKWTEQLKLD